MEPLSFKGRRGSGIAGDRCAYADASLRPHWDWEKYAYSHRVWGRLLYNPQSDPDTWQRYLRGKFGAGAPSIESALANTSRILPIVTTGHAASAGNNSYWPEVYLNQSMVDADHPGPYTDSPAPKVFGNVTPLDPQLFSRINDYADSLLDGNRNGKYSPIEVAQWLEDYATAAGEALARAEKTASGRNTADYRRMTIDAALEAGIGRFFAAKFRSGVLYRIYEKTGDRSALEQSLKLYRQARDSYADAANRARPVYAANITVGEHPQLRGHWLDRLPAMDRDIEMIAARLNDAKESRSNEHAANAIKLALARPRRQLVACRHTPAAKFTAGQPLEIEVSVPKRTDWIRLHYRHVDQAEDYQTAAMTGTDNVYRTAIPGAYTAKNFPLEYYFELKPEGTDPVLFPGFNAELANQPYFVVRRA